MKTSIPTILSIALFAVSQAIAQESAIAVPPAAPIAPAAPAKPMATDLETHIFAGISDGTPSVPAPKPPLPDFRVKGTVVRQFDVVEAPPMTGLPPVAGTITATVHLVEDPGLPDPPPPLPAVPVTDPAVLARMAELREKYLDTQLAFVSATVYDHSRTYLRCYASGEARSEICGWSNLDFNHFCGFGTYQVKGADGKVRQYALLMGIGDAGTKQMRDSLAKHGIAYDEPEAPELPDLATGGPTFVLTEGDTADKESVALIQGMHDIYRVEGARMAAAYEARLIAYEQRKAFLLAHPPKPKDVTIHFWERSHPVGMSADTIKKEGAK